MKSAVQQSIVGLLNLGHDLGYEATLTIYPNDSKFYVEIYDPLDDFGTPIYTTFANCDLLKDVRRNSDGADYWSIQFESVWDASKFYLDLVGWLKGRIVDPLVKEVVFLAKKINLSEVDSRTGRVDSAAQ